MILTIHEELYQTPLKFDFKFPYNGKADCVMINNCNRSYESNGNSKEYFLRNHQNRTVIDRPNKISQEGLEMRAQHQEAKGKILRNEATINSLLNAPVQSNRSQRHRKKEKYKNHIT